MPAFFYMPKIVHIMFPIYMCIFSLGVYRTIKSIYRKKIENRLNKFFRNSILVSTITIYGAIFISEEAVFCTTFMNYILTFMIVMLPMILIEYEKHNFHSTAKKIEDDKDIDLLNSILKESFELMTNHYSKYENLLYIPKFDSYLKLINKDKIFATTMNSEMFKRNGFNFMNDNDEKSFIAIVINKNDKKNYSIKSISEYMRENELNYAELTVKDFELLEMYNY